MKFNCAGKVFIVGEYSCIQGGPSLLGTVGPEFTLNVLDDPSQKQHEFPFAAQSPAGLYLNAIPDQSIFTEKRLEWIDPYLAAIGVGSSSAQFLLSVAAVAKLMDRPLPSAQEVLGLYWNTVGTSQGVRPSGNDVVAQWVGGPVIVRNNPYETRKLKPWSGGTAEFLLAFTGSKARTHEHLKALSQRDFPQAYGSVFERLDEITTRSIEAWEKQNPTKLGLTLSAYQRALGEGGLAAHSFTDQLEEMEAWEGVYGVKGSGAQGGDCVLFLIESEFRIPIGQKLFTLGWQPISVEWSNFGLRAT